MRRAEWRFRQEKPSNPRILDNPKKSQSNNKGGGGPGSSAGYGTKGGGKYGGDVYGMKE